MKAIVALLTFALTLLDVGVARGEGRCPPGMYPHDAPGVSACIPIPGAGSAKASNPAPPPPRWGSSWGAIATSVAQTPDAGYANGESTREEAQQKALQQCEALQGNRCKIVFTYWDQCAAFAWGSGKGMAIAAGAGDAQRAEALALQHCADANGSSCSLVHRACALPRRLP